MSDDYVFQSVWERQQREPLPEFGDSLFGKIAPSPFAIDRLPELKQEMQPRLFSSLRHKGCQETYGSESKRE